MKSIKKYLPAIIGLPILCYMIVSAIINTNRIEKDIQDNNFETIGKVTKFESNRSVSYYYFIYYYDNKKYSEHNYIDDQNRELCVGKYYKVNLSTKNPQYSKINLNEEISDSIKIANVGFNN